MLRSPQLRVVGAIALAVGAVEAGMVFLPDMAVLNFGVDAAAASLTMLPLVLTLCVGAPLAGWLLDHVGPRTVVQLGLALTVVGLLLFALLPLDWRNFYPSGALVGFGMSALLGAPLRYIALHEAGAERRGAGQGLLTLCVSVGQLVGAAMIGGVVGSRERRVAGLPARAADRRRRAARWRWCSVRRCGVECWAAANRSAKRDVRARSRSLCVTAG